MLKITGSPDKLAPSKNNNSKPISSKNNSSRPTFGKNNGNSKVRFGGDGVEYAKKSGKLKSQKLSKSKKLKSEKNHLSLEIWLSQEKSCQKMGIYLSLMLRKPDQNS